MMGKLFLSGGGDEKQTFKLDSIFLKNIQSILYIPVAWPTDDFERCLIWFSNMISLHKKMKITMLADLNRKVNLNGFDAVYIGGGNTFKLLKKVKESGFDKKLVEYYKNEGIIYGGSAGAIILGKDISTALLCKDKDANLVGLKNLNGLNLIYDMDVQCHFESGQIKEHQQHIRKTGRNIIAIPEESALLIENNNCKAIGEKPITIIKKDTWIEYKVNQNIQL